MRTSPFLATLLPVLASLALPAPTRAQDIGGIIDWIHRLSGPALVGPAVSYAWRVPELSRHPDSLPGRIRAEAAYRWSFDSDAQIDPDGSSVTAFSLRPSVEVPLFWKIELGLGLSLNRFAGDIDDPFWKLSYPVAAQLRWSLGRYVDLRAGVGGEYFPAFDLGDFDPLTVTVDYLDGEWAPRGYLGFDIKLR